MAEKVKNEHYVPQRYLKHFANGENFFVFDKEKADELCEASHNSCLLYTSDAADE